MNPFEHIEHIKDFEDFEEFDWFPEDGIADDYESIVDLKNTAELDDAEREIRDKFEYGEIEDDMLMWQHTEGLKNTMSAVFGSVYEKLCGMELDIDSRCLFDYTDKLGERAVVVRSGIGGSRNNGYAPSAAEARIKACLSENGTLIAVVSNEKWKNMRYREETTFFDDGMRAVQIIGVIGDDIIVNDFNDANGMGVSVPGRRFCELDGILLEVYK